MGEEAKLHNLPPAELREAVAALRRVLVPGSENF
jgi:hypothetical protein